MKFDIHNLKQTYVIAEMSGNHLGDIDMAKKIIYAAKDAGVDCVKIQTYTADTLTIDCDNHYFQIVDGTWSGDNLYQLYKKAYTPWEWQAELKELIESLGMDFLSTPFDNSAVDFLETLDVGFYKIASFELVDIPLIRYVASKGKPIILSTGMASLQEIEEAINAIKMQGNHQICLLRCASAYPAISESMNLKTMVDMKERFDVQVGLSDHSLGYTGAIAAVAMGAKVIEKHICLNRALEGPDASFSMEPQEFSEMVQQIRLTEKAIGTVNYGVTKEEESNVIFRKSLFVVEDISIGERFTEKNVRSIRPGYGLASKFYDSVLGKRATCDINRGTPLKEDMIDGGLF